MLADSAEMALHRLETRRELAREIKRLERELAMRSAEMKRLANDYNLAVDKRRSFMALYEQLTERSRIGAA
jgi:hypothetical protein